MYFIHLIFSLFLYKLTKSSVMSSEEIENTVKETVITCGSPVRIKNILTKYHLSSFGVNWFSGSHLQIVTGVKEDDKHESLFVLKEADDTPMCATGEPILCDSIIRLENIVFRKNLHSHSIGSMLGAGQEVCAFGEDGEGDANDNFKIVCYKNKDNIVRGNTEFFLVHVATEKYLAINIRNSMFHDGNCRGCPMNGQREVITTSQKDKQCLWKVEGGIIFSNSTNTKDDEDNDKKDDL